ncbi:MAG: hypothetical protein AAGA58_11400 [Verrucomicrobiota bacterium]
MNSKLQLIILILASLTLLASCDGKKKIKTEDGTVEIDVNKGEYTFQGKDGKGGTVSISGGGGAKIPDSFPADVHVYKPSIVTTAMSMAGTETVMLQTDDPAEKVIEKYVQEMADSGWEQISEMNTPVMSARNYEKDDRRVSVNVIADPKSGKATINLSVTPKRN